MQSKARRRVKGCQAGRVKGKESANCLLGIGSYHSDGKRNMMWSTSLLVNSDVETAGEREAVHGRGMRASGKKQHSVVEDRTLANERALPLLCSIEA